MNIEKHTDEGMFKDKGESIQLSFYKRLYNIFRWKDKIGNLYVLYRGQGAIYTIGPHWPGVLVVIALILGGTYVNYQMLHQKRFSVSTLYIFTVFIFTMMILTLTMLLLTALTDPGIMQATHISTTDDFSSDDFNVNIDGDTVVNSSDSQYCDICEIFQTPSLQISHCEDCNVCIKGHDHHCPWMGKCIGVSNMRFVIFVYCELYVCVCVNRHVSRSYVCDI
jgi:hypothetical protein